MAQTVSSVVDSGRAPWVGTRRAVLLKPTMPFRAAGMRMEPPVSLPRPMRAAPVATDTPAPDEEPPGMRGTSVLHGLTGVPKCGLVPTPENANSTIWVRPMKAAPARRKRATAGLSCSAGGVSLRTTEPAQVVCPATSNRSLMETARPASGLVWMPGVLAMARASSNVVCRKACWQAGDCAA